MIGLRQVALLALPLVAVLAACSLKADHCITMSDCDNGMSCNEGLCQGDAPPDTTLSADADTSSIEAGSSTSTSSTSDATTTPIDAGGDAMDASDAADAADDAPSDG